MSKVSEISRQYHDALTSSREDYTRLYQENSEATLNFYQEFFKDQVEQPLRNSMVLPHDQQFQ